jgi:hypothetical protein
LLTLERDIELDTFEIDHIFDWTIDGMNNVLSIVDKLQICTGIPGKGYFVVHM